MKSNFENRTFTDPKLQAIVSLNAKKRRGCGNGRRYDFHTGKLNNATQGLRQTGSAYKTIYLTAAVEWGMTPESTRHGGRSEAAADAHNYDGYAQSRERTD